MYLGSTPGKVPSLSLNVAATASGTLLGLKGSNGGNTAIGVNPAPKAVTRARDSARVGLGVVGKPPPPGVPGWGTFGSKSPEMKMINRNGLQIPTLGDHH